MARRRQIGVALDEPTREQLEKAAKENDRSIADEIRQRLDRTLYEDYTFDKPTLILAEDVRRLAQEVAAQAGSLTLPRVHEALAEAIKTWLELIKPHIGGAVSDLLGPSDPATLGRTIAHTLYRARPVERQGFWAASGRRLKQGTKPKDKS